jgi:HD superfamily phosphohydrolase
VIDFLRRDSLHLGLASSGGFDFGELLRHIRFVDGRLVITAAGLGIVEEIVARRYWMFNRIYWNRPNRALIAMIRHSLVALIRKAPHTQAELRRTALWESEEEVLKFLEEQCRKRGMNAWKICHALLETRPRWFEEIAQFTRAEDPATSNSICDKLVKLSVDQATRLQAHIDERVREEFHLTRNLVHILVDIPIEPGASKLGEDIDVVTRKSGLVQLAKLSGIVAGVQQGFSQHLQRIRIFMNPESLAGIKDRESLTHIVTKMLTSL